MITYDGLRVLIMAEDDSRCCFGLFGPLLQPNHVKIRPRACFFIARLMVMLPGLEISPKSQQITNNWIKKTNFWNRKCRQDRCPDVFFGGVHPRNTPKIPQNSNSYSDLNIKKSEMTTFRNQTIIGILLLVILVLLVF